MKHAWSSESKAGLLRLIVALFIGGLFLSAILSCKLVETRAELPGTYVATEYLGRDAVDALYDVLEHGVSLELTLTRDYLITDGRHVNPITSGFLRCPPYDEYEAQFEGSYSVRGDTVTFATNERCSRMDGSTWIYRDRSLHFHYDHPFSPVIVLTKTRSR